jgi:aspartyl-tRNA(Asn)/glutamyl-tRNA(Gln) amidotransferase subunit A
MDSIIKTIHRDLKAGKRSCVDLVSEKLSLLSADTCHTVNLLLEEPALAQAKQVDEKIKAGQSITLLEGVPFGISDVILLQNSVATGGSDFLRNYVSPYTATAIQKLVDAGAIPVAKEHCDSFGHGNTHEDGGANVANGYTAFSIGGDSGGTLRQSAGYHQVFGLKPTYGRVSRYVLMANASPSDCMGMLASTLEDIRILINTMSGRDPKDQTACSSSVIPENVFDSDYCEKDIVVGYYKSFLDDSIQNDFFKMLEGLSGKGVRVKALDFFDVDVLAAAYEVLAMAETSSNLARLDGSIYGVSVKGSSSSERDGGLKNFSDATKRRIEGGIRALSRGADEGLLFNMRVLLDEVIGRFDGCFQIVDVVLSPVCPKLELRVPGNPFTAGFSLGGLPALTAPFFMPQGIQITANKHREDLVLYFANVLQEMQ